jgi:hypothetical protein
MGMSYRRGLTQVRGEQCENPLGRKGGRSRWDRTNSKSNKSYASTSVNRQELQDRSAFTRTGGRSSSVRTNQSYAYTKKGDTMTRTIFDILQEVNNYYEVLQFIRSRIIVPERRQLLCKWTNKSLI